MVGRPGISVEVRGIRQASDALASVRVEAERGAKDIVAAAALIIMTRARTLIQRGPKTGRTYQRGPKGNILHQASAPGEPPATDTGTLAANVVSDVSPDGMTAAVVAGTDYARGLELGTRRIQPRPFLLRAVNESREAILQLLRDLAGRLTSLRR